MMMHHLDAKHKYEYDDKRLPLSIEKKSSQSISQAKSSFCLYATAWNHIYLLMPIWSNNATLSFTKS
jgi:hypothetical protein